MSHTHSLFKVMHVSIHTTPWSRRWGRATGWLGAVGAALVLSGCGGSLFGRPCGDSSQLFGVSFSPSSYTLTKNVSRTIFSTVSPENCRADMTFSIRSGKLPMGMALSDGNITGTPVETGTFSVTVQIDEVDNYKSLNPKPWGSVTLTVQP